jgi:pSer/pThr/pTyr-binding forkhead associated (FHA) protein
MMNLKPGEQAGAYDTRHYISVTGLGILAEGQNVTVNLGESICVGRSRHCDWSLRRTPSYLKMDEAHRSEVQLSHAYNSVSRKHARISYVAPDIVEIKNLSPNGTLVDGRLVDRLFLQDCRENSHKIQMGLKGVILLVQPGSLPL